ncbi:MAG: hypothetical protein GY818_02240 [Planctomycetaceae bacterium]|nr:hypothetical protein [Planctomycetaceae bacterium]
MAFKLVFAQQALVDALAVDCRQKKAPEASIYLSGKSAKGKIGTGLSETRAKCDSGAVVADRVYAGKVLAAIPKGRIFDSVAWFVYGPNVNLEAMDRVLQFVFKEFTGAESNKKLLAKFSNSRRVNSLIVYAALNYRYNRMNSVDRYDVAEMARESDISVSNWARDWAKPYQQMVGILDQIDKRILFAVRAMINQEKEKERKA